MFSVGSRPTHQGRHELADISQCESVAAWPNGTRDCIAGQLSDLCAHTRQDALNQGQKRAGFGLLGLTTPQQQPGSCQGLVGFVGAYKAL